MPQERLPKQTFYAKVNGERGQLDDHEQDRLITSRILVGTVWKFVQTKCSLCWRMEKCSGRAAYPGTTALATHKENYVKRRFRGTSCYLAVMWRYEGHAQTFKWGIRNLRRNF